MSSTGRVSKVQSSPLTSLGEERRQDDVDKTASPSVFEVSREIEGTIYKVHDEKLLVKVYDTADGSVVANNQWIPLSHSPQEIAERFGTIRPGMIARIVFRSPDGLNARATIIYNEQEKVGEEEFSMNEMETGLFEIFKPGM